ncbi:DUF4884 domain-containing protein [Achromobacter sp. AGC39]
MMHQKSDFISRHHGRATLRALICIVLAAMLTACLKEPVAVSGTDNQEIPVAELFTHEGVTVYRFSDGGRWVYFTSQSSDVTAQHTESCGKSCVRTETVETKGDGWIDQFKR